MRVLLVSTYEMGHQPLHLAAPATALAAAGHEVRTLDTSVEPWTREPVDWAEAVAFSVPMHTAMRLALRAAAAVRAARPDLPICLYGLYATVSRDLTLGPVDDTLPPLERYAHLALGAEERPVGYVEASHGCLHRCRHCPVPVIYDGRIRIVAEDVVLADVAALVEGGARHITFGDPDFLNGPQHSRRVIAALHARWPELTFDCTVKVEHILRHADLWADFAAAGCLFVVSAFESVNDEILARLDKGHTTADAAAAVALLRRHGIEIRPSFLPFTPWTTLDDVADLVDFVAALDLVPNVDPVQFTIRLLIPQGSLLEPVLAGEGRLGPYDAERLTWSWTSPDPAVDELQTRLAALVEGAQTAGEDIGRIYGRVRAAVHAAAGRHPAEAMPGATPGLPGGRAPALSGCATGEGRPRLTEPWFC
jgi:hypothetical protein